MFILLPLGFASRGNNGFLFILLAHRRRLSRGLLLPPILFPLVSVLLQRHEFGAEGRISP